MSIKPLEGRMWEISTGYTLWATKDRENQKSFSLYALEPNSYIYKKVGIIKNLDLFSKCFGFDQK